MGIITLTDRISVSVRAKNETEKSAQNKATGANIQKALGGSGLSDTDLEEIGNVNSVTDEDGNEWIPMNDWIGAGRKMKEKGAFKEETVYNGLDDGTGFLCALNPCYTGPAEVEMITNLDQPDNHKYIVQVPAGVNFAIIKEVYGSAFQFVLFSKNAATVPYLNTYDNVNYNMTLGGISETINGVQYSFFNQGLSFGINIDSSNISRACSYAPVYPSYSNNRSIVTFEAGTLFGTSHSSGGSIIDWDAPNAEVERQVKETRDTYYDKDVDQYFVLAGPIEYGSEGDAPDDNPNS